VNGWYRHHLCPHHLLLPKTVDLVYLDFIEKKVILAAKFAGLDIDIAKESDAYIDQLGRMIWTWKLGMNCNKMN
jgi:hypothetical protein